MPRVATIPADERDAKRPAWLNDVTKYHDRGDIDFSSCSDICFEQGDFFGLDDLFTENPSVMGGLAEVYAAWIRRYRIDGFRIDTARHVNRAFFRLWVPRILAAARAAGVPSFELFGEVPLRDEGELSRFVRERGLPNVLDFPFQDAAAGLAAGSTAAQALAFRLGSDDYFRPSPGVAPTPPTFLGNHDMGRAALMIQQRSQAGGELLLRRVLLGYGLLYLLRGAPVVYYGDEFGILGRGGDQQARQDLFPTQVEEWKTQERVGSPPIGDGSSFDVEDHPIETAPAGAGHAPRRPSSACDRGDDRPPRAGERPGRQPHRRVRPARVPGGVQLRRRRPPASRSRRRRRRAHGPRCSAPARGRRAARTARSRSTCLPPARSCSGRTPRCRSETPRAPCSGPCATTSRHRCGA